MRYTSLNVTTNLTKLDYKKKEIDQVKKLRDRDKLQEVASSTGGGG